MFSLSTADVLAIWERGRRQRPFEWGLAMLIRACPCLSREDLARLPIGQRDRLLLSLREKTFGPALASFAVCPQCREPLEFTVDSAELKKRLPAGNEAIAALQETTVGEYRLRFRPPNSEDLIEAFDQADRGGALERMRACLLERCFSEAKRKADPVSFSELPEEVIAQAGRRMNEMDAESEIELDVECPTCHRAWPVIFDIATFLYAEISVLAKRLLDEVQTLASAFGWSEKDILAMSAVRRQAYLDRVG
jgi:uncharacterized protein YbaR (Trm112 family)